jgi:hypothetical protein
MEKKEPVQANIPRISELNKQEKKNSAAPSGDTTSPKTPSSESSLDQKNIIVTEDSTERTATPSKSSSSSPSKFISKTSRFLKK